MHFSFEQIREKIEAKPLNIVGEIVHNEIYKIAGRLESPENHHLETSVDQHNTSNESEIKGIDHDNAKDELIKMQNMLIEQLKDKLRQSEKQRFDLVQQLDQYKRKYDKNYVSRAVGSDSSSIDAGRLKKLI